MTDHHIILYNAFPNATRIQPLSPNANCDYNVYTRGERFGVIINPASANGITVLEHESTTPLAWIEDAFERAAACRPIIPHPLTTRQSVLDYAVSVGDCPPWATLENPDLARTNDRITQKREYSAVETAVLNR